MEKGVFLLFGILALGAFVLSLVQFIHLGPPLNNSYLYRAKEDRENLNLGPLYRESGFVFFLIGLNFLCLALKEVYPQIFKEGFSWALTLFLVVYVIGSSLHLGRKNKA